MERNRAGYGERAWRVTWILWDIQELDVDGQGGASGKTRPAGRPGVGRPVWGSDGLQQLGHPFRAMGGVAVDGLEVVQGPWALARAVPDHPLL